MWYLRDPCRTTATKNFQKDFPHSVNIFGYYSDKMVNEVLYTVSICIRCQYVSYEIMRSADSCLLCAVQLLRTGFYNKFSCKHVVRY